MSSDKRFYQLELAHRAAVWGDIGNLIKVEGIVVGGEGAQAILMLPGIDLKGAGPNTGRRQLFTPYVPVHEMAIEEWTDFLQRSDNPEVLVMPAKAFHRKLRYEISGHVQQKVWVADQFTCMYCSRKMGDVQLTIDHFVPLEMGGVNDTSNYLSACRRCNKDKGSMSPQDWCNKIGKIGCNRIGESYTLYTFLSIYLAERKIGQ